MRLVSEDSFLRNLMKIFHFNYFAECVDVIYLLMAMVVMIV